MRCLCVLTELVSLPEAGQGGVETSALLLAGAELLQQLAHLLLARVQQPLQGHLARAHLLQLAAEGLLSRFGRFEDKDAERTLGSETTQRYLRDLFPQVDDAEPVAEAREVLQLAAPLL